MGLALAWMGKVQFCKGKSLDTVESWNLNPSDAKTHFLFARHPESLFLEAPRATTYPEH